MDPCYSNPCLNNGLCTNDGKGSALCSCHGDWTGSQCECKFIPCAVWNHYNIQYLSILDVYLHIKKCHTNRTIPNYNRKSQIKDKINKRNTHIQWCRPFDVPKESVIGGDIICKHICTIFRMARVYYLTPVCAYFNWNRSAFRSQPTSHFQQEKLCGPFRCNGDKSQCRSLPVFANHLSNCKLCVVVIDPNHYPVLIISIKYFDICASLL